MSSWRRVHHFLERHPWLSVQQRTVLRALKRCRTATLGGHVDQCGACGHRAISYNSCRNRHCPKCQAQARDRWLAARERELLDVAYVHVVFTLPHALLPLVLPQRPAALHLALSGQCGHVARGGRRPASPGRRDRYPSILHTWGQTLVRHPHVHCVVPAGGLSPDRRRWIQPTYAGFFLPIKVLSRVFRGKFVAALRRAYARGDLDLAGATEGLRDPAQWHTFVDALFQTDWVVYAKPAFGGASAVLRYLGRYTHRVAISNHRLIAFDGKHVTFRWKDYAHGNQWRTITLTAKEFLRRFVQHVLPRGFVRIRQFGYLASTCRTARLALARRLLTTITATLGRRPDTVGLALSAMRRADGHRPDSLRRSSWSPSHSAWTAHERPATSSRPASSATWWPTSRVRVSRSVGPACRIGHWVRPPDLSRRTAAAHAPPAPRSTTPHARGSRFQLHSQPPRQRFPSSLVIESASASISRLISPSRPEALPINASD